MKGQEKIWQCSTHQCERNQWSCMSFKLTMETIRYKAYGAHSTLAGTSLLEDDDNNGWILVYTICKKGVSHSFH